MGTRSAGWIKTGMARSPRAAQEPRDSSSSGRLRKSNSGKDRGLVVPFAGANGRLDPGHPVTRSRRRLRPAFDGAVDSAKVLSMSSSATASASLSITAARRDADREVEARPLDLGLIRRLLAYTRPY